MRLLFLAAETDRSDALSVSLTLGEALLAREHSVTFVTPGLPLQWRASSSEWLHVDDLSAVAVNEFDAVVACSWEAATGLRQPFALLCTGDSLRTADDSERSAVEEIHDAAKVLFTFTATLAAGLSHSPARKVVSLGPVVDERWFAPSGLTAHELLRVLIPGAWHEEGEAIDAAYGAATHARWSNAEFELVRLSQWSPSREEPLEHVGEFVIASTEEIALATVQSCDIVLATGRDPSTFPLRAAEAMAAGLVPIFSSIGDYPLLDRPADYALFAPSDDPECAGDLLLELIDDEPLRWRTSRRAAAVAAQFHPSRAAATVERLLLEISAKR